MQMIALVSNNFRGPFICSYCKSQYVNLVDQCSRKNFIDYKCLSGQGDEAKTE